MKKNATNAAIKETVRYAFPETRSTIDAFIQAFDLELISE